MRQTATDCNGLQQTATNCNTRTLLESFPAFHDATDCNRLHQTATDYNTAHLLLASVLAFHDAADCSRLQQTATDCNSLQHTATDTTLSSIIPCFHDATDCNRLQQTATDGNILQHIATDCNRLQQTATDCNSVHQAATACNTHTPFASIFPCIPPVPTYRAHCRNTPPTCATRIINMKESCHTYGTIIIMNMDEAETVATPPLSGEHALSIWMSHATHMEQSLSWLWTNHGQWQHPPYLRDTHYQYEWVMTHIRNNHYFGYGWASWTVATPPLPVERALSTCTTHSLFMIIHGTHVESSLSLWMRRGTHLEHSFKTWISQEQWQHPPSYLWNMHYQ